MGEIHYLTEETNLGIYREEICCNIFKDKIVEIFIQSLNIKI